MACFSQIGNLLKCKKIIKQWIKKFAKMKQIMDIWS